MIHAYGTQVKSIVSCHIRHTENHETSSLCNCHIGPAVTVSPHDSIALPTIVMRCELTRPVSPLQAGIGPSRERNRRGWLTARPQPPRRPPLHRPTGVGYDGDLQRSISCVFPSSSWAQSVRDPRPPLSHHCRSRPSDLLLVTLCQTPVSISTRQAQYMLRSTSRPIRSCSPPEPDHQKPARGIASLPTP